MMPSAKGFTAAGIVAVVAVVWFLPVGGLPPGARHALAVAFGMILGWIFRVADHAAVGLCGCFLLWGLRVVPFTTAFGGFGNSNTWFVLAALLSGAMAATTGLAKRMAFFILLRFGASYSRLLLGLVVCDLVLTLVVPSGTARVAVLAPVGIGLVQAFGLAPGSRVGRGVFVTITYTASIFDKMIVAGLAALAARGIIERIGHVDVLWSRWALACAPASAVTVIVAWRLALRLFPPERAALPSGAGYLRESLRGMGPWSLDEKKAAALFLAALGLWSTDFLHHLSPATVGLGLGAAALLPGIGVLPLRELGRVNYRPIVLIGTTLGMSQALVVTGALDRVTAVMIHALAPALGGAAARAAALYGAACAYHVLLGNEIAMVSTALPVLMTFARTHGLDPLAIGIIWTMGSGGKLFLYQSAVLVAGYSYGYFDARDLLRVGLWLTLVEGVVVVALSAWYWPLIGIG